MTSSALLLVSHTPAHAALSIHCPHLRENMDQSCHNHKPYRQEQYLLGLKQEIMVCSGQLTLHVVAIYIFCWCGCIQIPYNNNAIDRNTVQSNYLCNICGEWINVFDKKKKRMISSSYRVNSSKDHAAQLYHDIDQTNTLSWSQHLWDLIVLQN